MMRLVSSFALLAIMIAACGRDDAAPASEAPQESPPAANLPLVVYATIPASRIRPVLDAFTAETGKKVELVTGDKDILATADRDRGSLPVADLLLAGSSAELWLIAEMDGFRPTYSDTIEANIPPVLRDEEFRWTALGIHGRIVVYNTELVSTTALGSVSDYASLGDIAWRGKLCLSSSRVPGNRTLVAFLIHQYDLREAEFVVRNWRANFATGVFADDISLIEAIADGQCAIGIAGSNVFAAYAAANAAAPVALHRFGDPASTVVDASGAGVMRHARNPEAAAGLLAWLATNAPDALYAAQNQQFPANADAPVSRSVEPWRDVVSAPTPLSALGFLHEDAVLLNERARYP